MNTINLSTIINHHVFDSIDAPEGVPQETAWNLFREMRKIVHQYAPRFA